MSILSANLKASLNILLVVSPNFSINMLQEEIINIRSGESDFTKSVDWRITAPIGILYIAGTLRKAGYGVQIYDLHRAFYLCREEGYFLKNGLSQFFEDYFEKILKTNKIDILGISSLFNVSSSTVEEMGKRCRQISPFTKIVVGGNYPTVMYRELLRTGVCDYVILGEAEEEFVYLLESLKDSLPDKKICRNPHIVNLGCIDNTDKKPAVIENLDSLAMPAWEMLPHCEDYIENTSHADRIGSFENKNNKSAGIFTTRGCPMRCTYCASHQVHGRRVRAHSINYMMKHIDWLVSYFDINHLLIEDDMFNFSPQRTIEFCKALFKKHNKRFTIEFPNGLAVGNLNEEVIRYLKMIGLKNVTIAIESGNQYVQNHILKKGLNLSMVKQKVELFKMYNIGVRAFYIVGFVGETLEMLQDTIKFALDMDIDWSEFKIYTPLVGSEMGDIAKKKGYVIGDESRHVYRRGCIKTPEFTPEQVEDLHYDANIRINFLNNRNLKEKKYDVAEGIFSKLLNVYPNHLFAQWGLWKALEGQDKKEKAKLAFKKLVDMSKKDERNLSLLRRHNIQLKEN